MISTSRTAVDAYARQDTADTNYGTYPYLELGASANAIRQAFVYLSRPFPVGATIVRAILRVWLRGAWAAGPHTITARRITAAWKEAGVGGLVYNNRPAVDAAQSAAIVVPAGSPDATMIEIDVAAIMATVAAGAAFHGLRLEVDTAGAKRIHSGEATSGSLRPQLEIEWSVAPGKPTNLSPAGGLSASPPNPVLAWRFVDSPGEYQSAYQVQVDDASDFATPTEDSGWVSSGDSQHPVVVAIGDGALRYWRVRAKDNYGLASPWSDVAAFRRDTKGALAITNPPAAPATVDETSPPITHTLTGRAQEAVEYLLYRQRADATWALIWRSGKIATADTTHTLPEKALDGKPLITDAGPYRIAVRVWDTIDRAATPGDEEYVEATRDFTYVRSGAPAAVSSLAVSQGPGDLHAGVQLDWTRAAQPDFFAIKVDGRYVDTRIESADVLLGAPNYRMILWSVAPREAHDIEVEAVTLTGGKYLHSANNPVVSFTPEPVGIWLVAPEHDLRVAILGEAKPGIGIGESGETFLPVGRRDPVRIVDAIRGYEGALQGILSEWLGVSAREWRERLEAIKGLAHAAELRVIVGDLNFPVVIGEIDVDPTPAGAYEVKVPFWQTGEFAVDPVWA